MTLTPIQLGFERIGDALHSNEVRPDSVWGGVLTWREESHAEHRSHLMSDPNDGTSDTYGSHAIRSPFLGELNLEQALVRIIQYLEEKS